MVFCDPAQRLSGRGGNVRLFWKAPGTRRTRALTCEVFRVYEGSEGQQCVDHGLMAQVERAREKPYDRGHWNPPAQRVWSWGEGTEAPREMIGVSTTIPILRKAK